VATAPVTSLFFILPYPIATTSSKPMLSSSITIFKDDFPDVATSMVFIPTNEKTNVALSGIFGSENFPSISDITPVVVPFTTTETPGKVAPVASVTLPVNFFSCCVATAANFSAFGASTIKLFGSTLNVIS